MQSKVQVVGVYQVPGNSEVHLIEVFVQAKASEVEIGGFTQEDPNRPQDSWQVAYDEHYLNEAGTEVVGTFMSDLTQIQQESTRLAFYLYFIDFSRPIRTPYGEVMLPSVTDLPERLRSVIEFVEVD